MQRFTFNTGVKRWINPHILGGIDSGNGTVVIPFYCKDVTEGSTFICACDNPEPFDNPDSTIVREIFDSKLGSKYAHFRIAKI